MIRTIAVCLNDLGRCEALLRAAAELSVQHDAHVTGVYVIPGVWVVPFSGFDAPPVVFEDYQRLFESNSERIKALFEQTMKAQDLPFEWRQIRSETSDLATSAVEAARIADLVIVSQTVPGQSSGVDNNFTERMVMESGRPTLVIPYNWNGKSLGKSVLVAWNGSREAARAAFDAIGLLQKAGSVHLTWVDPQKSADGSAVCGADMASTLARHDINVTAEGYPTSRLDAGSALAQRIQDLGADLLVMGAYGHSRMREYVFGGATQFMLDSPDVPVLMSH